MDGHTCVRGWTIILILTLETKCTISCPPPPILYSIYKHYECRNILIKLCFFSFAIYIIVYILSVYGFKFGINSTRVKHWLCSRLIGIIVIDIIYPVQVIPFVIAIPSLNVVPHPMLFNLHFI